MNKNTVCLCALLIMVANNASAGLKLDALSMLERAPLDFAGDLSETAGVVTDAAAMGKEVYQKGTRAKALFEKTKLKVQNVMEKFDSLMPGYNGEPEAGTTYEEQEAEAEAAVNELPTSLEVESKTLSIEMDDRKDALLSEAEGRKTTSEENIAILNVMLEDADDPQTRAMIQSKINEHQAVVNEQTDIIVDLNSENSEILAQDESYQSLNEEKKQADQKLQDKLANAAKIAGVAGMTLSKVAGFLKKSPEEKGAAYSEVLENNFILPEEAKNAESVSRVRKYRTKVLVDSMVEAIVAAAKFQNSLDKEEEESYKIQDNTAGAEQQLSAIAMMTEHKIQETQLLHEYNKLILANMKLQTALNMNNQDYKLKNYSPEKNPAVLNLDNYVFDEDDIVTDEKKKGFLDNIKAK